jgi:hypothetical protein
MDIKTYTAPLLSAVTDPIVVGALLFLALMTLANWLQHRKNVQLQQLGQLIAMGGGIAYKAMALRAAGGGALTAAGLAALEQQAVGQGVAAIKDAATKTASPLPDAATLAAHVAGKLGALLAADPTVTALPPSAPPAAEPARPALA